MKHKIEIPNHGHKVEPPPPPEWILKMIEDDRNGLENIAVLLTEYNKNKKSRWKFW